MHFSRNGEYPSKMECYEDLVNLSSLCMDVGQAVKAESDIISDIIMGSY